MVWSRKWALPMCYIITRQDKECLIDWKSRSVWNNLSKTVFPKDGVSWNDHGLVVFFTTLHSDVLPGPRGMMHFHYIWVERGRPLGNLLLNNLTTLCWDKGQDAHEVFSDNPALTWRCASHKQPLTFWGNTLACCLKTIFMSRSMIISSWLCRTGSSDFGFTETDGCKGYASPAVLKVICRH